MSNVHNLLVESGWNVITKEGACLYVKDTAYFVESVFSDAMEYSLAELKPGLWSFIECAKSEPFNAVTMLLTETTAIDLIETINKIRNEEK